VRERRGLVWVGFGVLALAAYGFVATFQPDANFGRILAAMNNVATSLLTILGDLRSRPQTAAADILVLGYFDPFPGYPSSPATPYSGFALTQLEAMAHGLPVITTPNCGRVVTEGLDGFIVPPRDAAALADRLRTLLEDPERLQAMREAAQLAVFRFNLDHLDKNLRDLESLLKGPAPSSLPSFA
jgi:glycosyltransferase involved in cell wall biosynthesis